MMKSNIRIIIIILLFIIFSSCQKREWNNLYDPNNTLDKTLPIILGEAVSIVTFNTAKSGGSITLAGGSLVTARGVCWSTTASPTIANSKTSDGTGVGSFKSNIYGLSNNIKYYFRAYATNSIGTAYGSEYSVILYMNVPDASVTDIDGNTYKTVKIGNQIWMAENLKVTKYNDGTVIPNETDNAAWAALTIGAYCYYNNDAVTYKENYGALYNWYSVNTNKLAPVGWHVSTDAEWTTLTTYLGGDSIVGSKLKESGTSHWLSPNTDATNEISFTALPAGYHSGSGAFNYIGYVGFWWSSTEFNSYIAWFRVLYYNTNYVDRHDDTKEDGFSVRCVRDY